MEGKPSAPSLNEQTPLLASLSRTNELVDQTSPRPYRKQSQYYHIIVTAAITLIIAFAVAATVYFVLLQPSKDEENLLHLYRRIVKNNEDYNRNDFNSLLTSSWPRQDAVILSYPAVSFISVIEEAIDHGRKKLKDTRKDNEELLREEVYSVNGENRRIKLSAPRFDETESSTEVNDLMTHQFTFSSIPTARSPPKSKETNKLNENPPAKDSAINRLSDLGFIENEASKYLKNKNFPLTIKYHAAKDLLWTNETGCHYLSQKISCEPSPYRTLDGFCNNIDNPRWGTAMKPFRRALPAAYDDGVSEPRGRSNSDLPSVLDVSIESVMYDDQNNFTEMLMIWGEFINHDLSVAAKYIDSKGEEIDCCQSKNSNNLECFPLTGNSTGEQSKECFNFIRSLPALRCSFGPREQLNEVSSFLDGSLLYGNTEYLGGALRKFVNGLLELPNKIEELIWLPPIRAAVEGYNSKASWSMAFKGQSSNTDKSSPDSKVGAWNSGQDLSGPWKLIYDPARAQWLETRNEKPSLKSSSDAKKSMQFWYEREIPWGIIDEERDSRKLHNSKQENDKEKLWSRNKYFSTLGDFQPNEYAQAGSMRSIFAQQHNRIANTLQSLHPEWNDETIFQETKRIVIAQMQHITYSEFLPHILGDEMMRKLDLYPKKKGYWTGYNKNVNPTISNHFAVAASKLSRTMIKKKLTKISKKIKKKSEESEKMMEHMHEFKYEKNYWLKRSLEILKGNVNFLIDELKNNDSTDSFETTSREPLSTFDPTEKLSFISTTENAEDSEGNEGLKNGKREKRTTFLSPESVFYDIQRGRDHGLPGYIEWRKYCNLSDVRTFDDLKPIFTTEAQKNVSQLYKSVQDIDLFTGALSEKPIPGSIVGPTSTCLLADQYYRVKYGDRYWYETYEKPQAFSPEQLTEIRKTTLAGIMCANIGKLTHVPRNIIKVVDENNKLVSCADFGQPDLSYWFSPSSDHKYPSSVLDTNARQKFEELKQEYHHFSPYLERIGPSLEPAVPEWTSQLNDSVADLPSYISNWLSNYTPSIDAKGLDKAFKLPLCNITLQTRQVDVFRKKKQYAYHAPREILVNIFHNQNLVWSPNASDSLNSGFKIINKTGDFSIELFNVSGNVNYTCIELKPECVYYSKIILGDLTDEPNLFEVSVQTIADTCSVFAPVLLKGYYVDEDTFYWTGGITIFTNEERNALSKEEELSFHPPVRRNWLSLPKLNGTLTVRDHGKWNGKLPVVLNISTLAWYSTPDTLVYPVEWSGFYQGASSFEGVFLLPQKHNISYIKWYDGEFSIALPKMLPDLFKELIQSNRVYSSIVYFTSNPSGIDRFDISAFNKLHDWIFADYSQILVVGHFDQNGQFHWTGNISFHMKPLGYEYPSTTYRPYGKYLFKILEGNLFGQLGLSGGIKKWWAGVLPPSTIIPTGEYNDGLRAHVLDQYLIWSYDNFTAIDGNSTFRMLTTNSKLKLWGDFEFQFAFLMDGIWTSTLKPNVTYFSPILLQYERMTYDFGDDMPERLLSAYQRPDLGVLAPITLLGEFHNVTAFNWNTEALVTVIQK